MKIEKIDLSAEYSNVIRSPHGWELALKINQLCDQINELIKSQHEMLKLIMELKK